MESEVFAQNSQNLSTAYEKKYEAPKYYFWSKELDFWRMHFWQKDKSWIP